MTSQRRAPSATFWSCALLVGAVIAGAGWFLYSEHRIAGRWGFSLDDSWIYATFARNIATGKGYSFNAGERVAGATGPLYALILALFYRLFHEVVWSAKVFGIACLCGSSVLMYLAARNLTPRSHLRPLWVGLLVGISPSLLWGALSGMEIAPYIFLNCLGIYCYTKERWILAALCWSLGVWLRPDGLLLALMGLFLRPKLTARGMGTTLLVVAPVLAAFFAFNYVVGGRFLPNSVLVKTHFGPGVLPQIWEMLQRWAPLWGLAMRRWDVPEHSIVLLPAMMIGAVLMARRFPALAAFILGLPLGLAIFGASSGSHGRYMMPVIPFGVLLAAEGLNHASGRALGRRWKVGLFAAALFCVAWQVRSVERKGIVHGWNVENINDMQRLLAETIRASASPGDTIAVNDVGAMGYFSGCYIVDLVGLVSPLRSFPENLKQYRPKYLVIFPAWFRQYAAVNPVTRRAAFYDADSAWKYVPVAGARLRTNTICSRDRMLVFARMSPDKEGPENVQMMVH